MHAKPCHRGALPCWEPTANSWRRAAAVSSRTFLAAAAAAANAQRAAQGASGKGPRQKRQKSSKSVKNIFVTFRHFFAQGKNRQKSSKSVKTVFDTFRQFSRGTNFPAPFEGALKC